MKNPFIHIGPAALVTAAFIGPGTITVCSLAGAQFGMELIWVLLLAIVATIFLQMIAARIGLISQNGIAHNIRNQVRQPLLRRLSITLIFIAIVIGNLAYEAGNLSGALIGADLLFDFQNNSRSIEQIVTLVITSLAFILLWSGKHKLIERSLIGLVLVMSIVFIIAAIYSKPNPLDVLRGALVPTFDANNVIMITALVGTTIVPYNLFLHASLVSKKWHSPNDLPKLYTDTVISIAIGGIVSIGVLIVAASVRSTDAQTITQITAGLQSVLGDWGGKVIGLGIFCAGLTSAITAPLAAGLVAQECFDWPSDPKSTKYRLVWITVLLAGFLFTISGFRPIAIIKLAQVANGILLPVVVGFILWIGNSRQSLSSYKNSTLNNIIGLALLLFTVFLGLRSLSKIFGFI